MKTHSRRRMGNVQVFETMRGHRSEEQFTETNCRNFIPRRKYYKDFTECNWYGFACPQLNNRRTHTEGYRGEDAPGSFCRELDPNWKVGRYAEACDRAPALTMINESHSFNPAYNRTLRGYEPYNPFKPPPLDDGIASYITSESDRTPPEWIPDFDNPYELNEPTHTASTAQHSTSQENLPPYRMSQSWPKPSYSPENASPYHAIDQERPYRQNLFSTSPPEYSYAAREPRTNFSLDPLQPSVGRAGDSTPPNNTGQATPNLVGISKVSGTFANAATQTIDGNYQPTESQFHQKYSSPHNGKSNGVPSVATNSYRMPEDSKTPEASKPLANDFRPNLSTESGIVNFPHTKGSYPTIPETRSSPSGGDFVSTVGRPNSNLKGGKHDGENDKSFSFENNTSSAQTDDGNTSGDSQMRPTIGSKREQGSGPRLSKAFLFDDFFDKGSKPGPRALFNKSNKVTSMEDSSESSQPVESGVNGSESGAYVEIKSAEGSQDQDRMNSSSPSISEHRKLGDEQAVGPSMFLKPSNSLAQSNEANNSAVDSKKFENLDLNPLERIRSSPPPYYAHERLYVPSSRVSTVRPLGYAQSDLQSEVSNIRDSEHSPVGIINGSPTMNVAFRSAYNPATKSLGVQISGTDSPKNVLDAKTLSGNELSGNQNQTDPSASTFRKSSSVSTNSLQQISTKVSSNILASQNSKAPVEGTLPLTGLAKKVSPKDNVSKLMDSSFPTTANLSDVPVSMTGTSFEEDKIPSDASTTNVGSPMSSRPQGSVDIGLLNSPGKEYPDYPLLPEEPEKNNNADHSTSISDDRETGPAPRGEIPVFNYRWRGYLGSLCFDGNPSSIWLMIVGGMLLGYLFRCRCCNCGGSGDAVSLPEVISIPPVPVPKIRPCGCPPSGPHQPTCHLKT